MTEGFLISLSRVFDGHLLRPPIQCDERDSDSFFSVDVCGGPLISAVDWRKESELVSTGFQRVNRDDRGTMDKRDSGLRNSSGSLAMTEE